MAPQITNINNPYAGVIKRDLLGATAIQPTRATRLAMGAFTFRDDGHYSRFALR